MMIDTSCSKVEDSATWKEWTGNHAESLLDSRSHSLDGAVMIQTRVEIQDNLISAYAKTLEKYIISQPK